MVVHGKYKDKPNQSVIHLFLFCFVLLLLSFMIRVWNMYVCMLFIILDTKIGLFLYTIV